MKSLDYINKRIAEGNTGLSDCEYEFMMELDFKEKFKELYGDDFPECNRLETKANDKIISEVIYDPDADFNYFSMERVVHDGTFLFIAQSIEKLFYKVFTGNTYNRLVIDDITEEFLETHHFKYTVGNIVLGTEFDGDFVPEDKKWMRERSTLLLPIKFEVVKII